MNLQTIRSWALTGAMGLALIAGAPAANAFQFAFAPAPPAPPAPPDPHVTKLLAFAPAMLAGNGSFLGVGVAEITPDRARDLKLREESGVEITRLEDDSPAAKAGLKVGDVILEYNGQRVEGLEQFGRLVRETPAGRTVKLAINRGGASQIVQATVGSRKSHLLPNTENSWHFEMPDIQIPEIPGVFTIRSTSMLGVETESLGPQLSEYFGVKEGVLVRSVAKASPAEKAGLKAGDVITKVDQSSVATANDLINALRSARSKKAFPVQAVREHRETTVTVTLDDDRSSGRELVPRTRVVRIGPLKM